MSENEAIEAKREHQTAVESAYDHIEHFDILETITNVGNDEVFTPRKVCDAMLNSLPEEVWHNPSYKWLNPATKNGVFEREIAIRLDEGLKDVIKDEEQRRKHILQDMIFALGETLFTANVARRTLYYCSQANRKCDGIKASDGHYVNGYAIGNGSWFDNPEGNIKSPESGHAFWKGKCKYCGIRSDSKYVDEHQKEQYAYEFIHHETLGLQDYFGKAFFKGDRKMKFDIIIGNPPYQLNTNSTGQAIPIYHLFVEQAIRLNPKYLCMIIPSKWFAGGMGSLDEFRNQMMRDHHIKLLVDYSNAKECFPSNSVGGGVCYFVWDRDYNGPCKFTNINSGTKTVSVRNLDEFPVVVRYNVGVRILQKVLHGNPKCLDSIASPLTPFGLSTSVRGEEKPTQQCSVKLYSSESVSYISKDLITKGLDYVDKYKVIVGKLGAEHALEPDKDGKFRIITSSMKPIGPNSVCTHSYFVVGPFDTEKEANSLYSYLRTKFARFLILLSMTAINLSRSVLIFVPIQVFDHEYSDQELFEKYKLDDEEIAFIESTMKEMF